MAYDISILIDNLPIRISILNPRGILVILA